MAAGDGAGAGGVGTVSESANKITAEVLLRVSEELPTVILWRQNAGMGLPLAYVKAALGCLRRGDVNGAIKALSSRPFRAGVTGTADLSGIGPGGRRVEVEIKATYEKGHDTISEDQIRFRDMIERHGGVYCCVTSADDAIAQLKARF